MVVIVGSNATLTDHVMQERSRTIFAAAARAPVTAKNAIEAAMRIHGNLGYATALPLQQRFRDVMANLVADGNAEIRSASRPGVTANPDRLTRNRNHDPGMFFGWRPSRRPTTPTASPPSPRRSAS
jgi:hypothetical protein